MDNNGLPTHRLGLGDAVLRREREATQLTETGSPGLGDSQTKNHDISIMDGVRAFGAGALSIPELAGYASGRLADALADTNAVGRAYSNLFRAPEAIGNIAGAAKERVESGMSEDAQAARELPFFEEDERGKITGIGDGMKELDVVALKFAEGLGSIVPTLGAGGLAGGIARNAIIKRATQAGYTKGQAEYIAATAQAQLASKVTGGAAATGVGTAAHIGGAGKDPIEDLKQLPAETRIMSESGKRIYGQVLSEEAWKDKTPFEQQEEMFRRQELELSGSVMTDPRTVALGVAGTVLGDVGLLNMLSGAGKQAVKSTIGGGIASSALKGFGMEGVAEGLQGGGQQYLTNEQLIEQADSDVAPWKGVASSALEEGIIGGLSGGAIGGYSGSRNNKARKQLESAEQQQSELDQQQTDAEVENQTGQQEPAPTESADGPAEITITPEIDRSDLPQVVPSDDARVGREFAFPAGSGDVYQVIESMGGQMYRVANLNTGETLNINTGEARGGLQIDSLIAQYEQNKEPEAQEVNETGDATRTESNPLGPSQSEFDERRDIPSYLRQDGDIDGRDVQPIWSDDEAQQALSRGESAPTVDELIQQEQAQPGEQEQREIDAAIQSAGFEADGIWRELSNLRVTKRGKPFASEKEAQMASRKDEQPVKLPEGYGVAKQAEVAEAQESLAKQSQMTESEREQQPAKQTQVAGGPIVEASVADLKLSNDVPQFKDGANKDGIVEALGGTFDRTGVAPIQVWQRSNGDMEVISGRHRLDLARRSGEKTIPAQVHKESDGFNQASAATLDAELNIRDNQGKVKDYVQYFQATGIDRAEADRRGYTARALGRRAHTIATEGSEETIAAHSAGRITDEGAERISQTAPGDARLQAVGVKSTQDGKSITHATNMMQAVKALSGGQQGDGMGDMFGFDDSGMREAEQMATLAASKQREINELLRPQRAVSRSGKRAEQEGITDNLSPEQRKARMENLQELKAAWDNWSTNPELVAELRSEIKGEEAPALSTYSEADLQQQADQLKQSQQAEQVEQERYDADQELDGFNLTGSDSTADVAMAQGQADIFADAPKQEGLKTAAAHPQVTNAIADNGDTNQAPQGGNAISRMSPRERSVGTISYISNADKGAIESWIDSNRITDEQLRGVIDRGYTSAELRNIIESNLHPELDLTDVAQRDDSQSTTSQLKPESRLDTAADKISAKKLEAAKKLKKLIDSRKGSLNSGVDPEVMLAVAEVGALSIAEGAVKFAQYVRDVLTTTQAVGLNDADVKPFLKESYAAISANPEKYGVSDTDADNMQTPRELRKMNIDELTKTAEQATQEPDNDQRATADTTADRANQDDGPAKTGSDIQHEGRGSSGQRAGEAGQESNLGPLGVINSLDDVRSTTDGERSDQSGSDGESRSGRATTGSADSGRSANTGTGRLFAERRGKPTTASSANPQAVSDTPPAKLGKVASTGNTLSDVKARMPFLTDGQADDVVFAEKRFSKPDGFGVLFTNGTGTGKTFTGLGIARRMVDGGKDNILVLAPKQTIADGWSKAASKFFGLDVKPLKNTKDNGGSGPVVTTYANLASNPSLLQRDWDLIIPDEAHYLNSDQAGKDTKALEMVRMLARKPGTTRGRVYALNEDMVNEAKALRKEAKELRESINLSPEQERYSIKADIDKLTERSAAIWKSLDEMVAEQKTKDELIKDADKPRAALLSATPFAYEKNVKWANGFLFDWGDKDAGGYNSGGAYESFMMQHFGYSMRYNKLTEPDAKVDRGLMQRAFNSYLKKEGALSARMLESDHDYDRRFVLTENAIGTRVDEALQWLSDSSSTVPGMDTVSGAINKNFAYLPRMYLLEAIKAEEVISHVKEQQQLGRKVLIIHDFKKGGSDVNPLQVPPTVSLDDAERAAYALFKDKYADLINAISQYPSALETLTKAFPNAMVYNGDVPAKKRIEMQDRFNEDGETSVMIAQSDAMREGVSIHDTTGKHQRVSYNLGLPTRPTASIQLEGRTYRTGQKSDTMFRYLTIGTSWERTAFATTIAGRASAAENLAMGEQARGLKESFIQAYEQADDSRPGFDGEGQGGKAKDRELASALTPWDMAKSYYYGSKKQGAGRGSRGREGSDFFSTPEPVGMKMAAWADLKGGESALEPSVGSAAIGRWFPENTRNRAIEPSAELASQAALRFNGEVVNSDFESHNIINKYDAVVMNPPFGRGGKLAAEHVAKALGHLSNEGRVVALIPEGPAADKRFNELLYGEDAIPDVYMVGEVKLPTVAFERAGTKVPTRIIVLDKQTDQAKAETLQSIRHDLTSESTIGALFDRLENIEMPARQASESDKSGAASSGTEQDGAADNTAQSSPTGEIIEHTTKKGRVIRGIVRTDLDKDQAKAIDPYTFKKNGGYFIREKHLSDQPLDLATFKNLSSTITTDAKPAGISVSQAQSVADAFLKAYKGNIPLEVIIRDTQEELYGPEATIANVKQIKGAYHPARGVFTLAASNLSSMQDAIETIRHEVLGHYGLNTFTPADKRKILDQLIEARDTKGPLADIWAEIDNLYSDDTNDIRAEEVFARVVELEPAKVGKLKAFVDRLLHNLNVAMRRVGLVKGPLKLNDVRRTARYVAEGIRSGRRKQQTFPATDDALFRVRENPTATESGLSKLNLNAKPDVIDKAKQRVQALREMDRKTASSWITRVGRKANTEMLDALAPIKYVEEALGINDADNSGYIASRLATGSSSTMLGAMLHGLPVWKDGVIQRKKGSTEKDALLGVIEPLGKDLHNWLGWMAGHRAELLMEQGRENLLTADEIQGLKALGKGKEKQFNEAKQKWNTFNGAILDLAQESGLVSAEARANFESEWYIPFFRETEDGDVLAPFSNKGIANQRAGINKLKGGTNKTNDLLENMFHTTGKMIDASMKNHAARKTVENLMDSGIIEVIESPNIMDMRAKDKGKEVFTIRHNGEDVYVRILDKDLFRAMTFLDRKPFDDPFTKVGMSAKRLLTATVTSSPEFMLRNFLRDMLSAWVISKDDYNPLDAFKGALKAYKMDGAAMDMMFAGSSFMGGYVNANDPQGMADTVRKGLRRKGLSPEQITKYEKSIIRNASQAKGVIADAWAKYNRYGEAAENATREAVYAAAIKDGKSKAQAAFDAKDQMDFSMLGASRALQWLTAVLPFFNARIQGLGKLSREFKDNPAGVAKRGGYIVAGTMALLASNWDRKEYEELPDWDKDMHWHVWLGEQHFRIPKPFEVGVIFGTIPERAVRAMGDKDTGAEFGKAVVRAMAETFALNPIPQAVNPIAEVAFNYDIFKGRAIESQYDARLRPEARYDERTSLAMRELGDTLGISPKKAEHLVRGYLGSMGAYAMMAADVMISAGKDEGSSPASKIWEWPVVKAVYQGDGSSPAKSTKQLGQLYEMLDKVTELHNTVSSYRKDNRIEDANKLVAKEGDILRARSSLTGAQKQLRQIRNQIDLVRKDKKLTSEEKRERIDRLISRRNDLAARAVQQNKEWFK